MKTPATETARQYLALPNRQELTRAQAAKALGITPAKLIKALQRAGVRTGNKPGPGPRQPVQDADYLLAEWAHLREGGVSIEEAARRLNTTVYTLQEAS